MARSKPIGKSFSHFASISQKSADFWHIFRLAGAYFGRSRVRC
jgi:hypothetical protein